MIIVAFDRYNNNLLTFYDALDYATLGADIKNVTQVRFLFSTYDSVLDRTMDTDTLTANYEYEVESGTISINGVSYTTGDTFVPNETIDTPSGGVVNATGWFTMYTDQIPTEQIYDGFAFDPSQVGEGGETFEDKARSVRYEIYTTEYSASTVTVSTETQFIVRGTEGDYIEIGSEDIYVGQVFTKDSNFTFTGTPTVCTYEASDQTDFATDANAQETYQDYINNLSNTTLNESQDYKDNFIRTATCVGLYNISADTDISYSMAAIQQALDVVNNYLSTTNNNIR